MTIYHVYRLFDAKAESISTESTPVRTESASTSDKPTNPVPTPSPASTHSSLKAETPSHNTNAYKLELLALDMQAHRNNRSVDASSGVLLLKDSPRPTPNSGKRDSFYERLKDPKGLALVISNQTYGHFADRPGSCVDLANISMVLQKLQYDVWCEIDRRSQEMQEDVEKFVAKFDASKHDSVIVVLLTNWIAGCFVGVDGSLLDQADFFRAVQSCSSLHGKPKIFIIQACRPSSLDPNFQGIHMGLEEIILTLIEKSETEASKEFIKKIPHSSDTLILFSTTPGYFSWHEEERGSWFIQAVCEELAKNSWERWADLQTLSGNVLARISSVFAPWENYVELPGVNTSMKNKFHFFPGTTQSADATVSILGMCILCGPEDSEQCENVWHQENSLWH